MNIYYYSPNNALIILPSLGTLIFLVLFLSIVWENYTFNRLATTCHLYSFCWKPNNSFHRISPHSNLGWDIDCPISIPFLRFKFTNNSLGGHHMPRVGICSFSVMHALIVSIFGKIVNNGDWTFLSCDCCFSNWFDRFLLPLKFLSPHWTQSCLVFLW